MQFSTVIDQFAYCLHLTALRFCRFVRVACPNMLLLAPTRSNL